MKSVLPGKSSQNTAVALTKVIFRLFGFAEFANAIGDLTGLGQANIQSLVQMAEKDLAGRPSAEFTAIATADREWVEGVLVRTYVRLATDPARQIMGESLIGAEAVVELAREAMAPDDLRDLHDASDDARAYLTALSDSIACLISEWYSTNAEPNRAAMSQAAGETLQTVRTIPNLIEALKVHFDSSLASVLSQLEQSTLEDHGSLPEPEPEPERIVFELDFSLAPLASVEEFAELVKAAVVAVIEERLVDIEVSFPALDEAVKTMSDAVQAAQAKRIYQDRAQRLRLALTAFFSPQVETAWATYLGVPDRITVVRAILATQETTGAKLDVWRTTPPRASAPIWLTPEEVDDVVESVGLKHWDHLRFGAVWRAADELPRSVIIEKVMPSILTQLARGEVTSEPDWTAGVLSLPSWHIGQG